MKDSLRWEDEINFDSSFEKTVRKDNGERFIWKSERWLETENDEIVEGYGKL